MSWTYWQATKFAFRKSILRDDFTGCLPPCPLFIALDRLFVRRTQRHKRREAEPDHDPSVFPLATPLIAGLGAIASVLLLVGKSGQGWSGTVAVLALMIVMIVVTYGFLLASPPLERMLGRTGIIVITRLLGMLLAALSVQFVIDGVKGTGLID